jgi:hypothetical protein
VFLLSDIGGFLNITMSSSSSTSDTCISQFVSIITWNLKVNLFMCACLSMILLDCILLYPPTRCTFRSVGEIQKQLRRLRMHKSSSHPREKHVNGGFMEKLIFWCCLGGVSVVVSSFRSL